MTGRIEINNISASDFGEWLPLWNANNQDHINHAVTTETWQRLTDPACPVHGLTARKDGKIVGLLHFILHPTTGQIEPVCYMQDLFVDPAYRRQGIARELLRALERTGKKEKWARIYWLAESGDEAVQNFYKNIGVKLDFTLHILPL